MTKSKFEMLIEEHHRQYIDWLFSYLNTELNIPLSVVADETKRDYRTLSRLKKGAPRMRRKHFSSFLH